MSVLSSDFGAILICVVKAENERSVSGSRFRRMVLIKGVVLRKTRNGVIFFLLLFLLCLVMSRTRRVKRIIEIRIIFFIVVKCLFSIA